MSTPRFNYEKILTIYAEQGATAAAEEAGVSKRTVQRWAAKAKIKSGYVAPIRRTDPSAAAYLRGCRTPECVEEYRKSNQRAKDRRMDRFEVGQTVPDCGKASTYSNYDCRGEACRAAWSKYLKDKRFNPKGADPAEQLLVNAEGDVFGCPKGLNPLED